MNVSAENPNPNPSPERSSPVGSGFDPQANSRAAQRPFRDRAHDAQFSAFNPRVKSPLIASFLSLAPGLGQIYVGYYLQGFLHAGVVATLITLLASDFIQAGAAPWFGLFLPFFWLYNIVDAGRRAAFYNEAMQGEDLAAFGDLPKFGQSAASGSIGLGIALLAIGSILLSRTAFGLSLDWFAEWWPIAPIALGIWLCVRGVADRKR